MILDTNALSALFKKEPGIEAYLKDADQLYVPVIVIGEYLFGLQVFSRAGELKKLLTDFLRASRVLSLTVGTADFYADIRGELKRAGTPIPENDIWIAALVREYALPILSRDVHFDYVKGVERLSW